MSWAELDLAKAIWRLPAERAKNKRAHEVQLSTAACAVLDRVPRIGAYVLTVSGTAPATGFYRAKNQVDAAMLAAKRA
jgi:hypothetical protein